MLVLFFVLVNLCFSQNDPATDGTQWTSIYASDFSGGTYRIKTAGYYRLMEDVWFDAKSPSGTQTPYDAYTMSPADFTSNGGPYDDLQYQVGFWAAITIESDHVTIDLNGHWIGQAPGHNLMNRFFNVIELGNQPFISGQGFANFGPVGSLARDSLVPSNSITIQNGGIGRTATNGIHGIGNKNILIENVAFRDFETSAVSVYGADTVVINRCSASSSKNVPVSAHFFTALQMRPYINFLAQKNPSYTLTVAGTALTASDIQNSLKNVINDVYAAVITNQKQLQNSPGSETAASLFRNDWGRPDGNCFGFGTMGRNLDTVGFPFGYTEYDQPSQNINITFSGVYDLECAPLEVVALTSRNDMTPIGVNQVPVVDARGQVFSILQMNYDATQRNMATSVPVAVSFGTAGDVTTVSYVGNAVTNAQAIVGKAILQGVLTTSASGLEVRRSTFNADLLAWIAAAPGSPQSPLSSYINPSNPLLGTRDFICNGDESYKVQIGVNAIRIAGTWNFGITDSEAGGIRNFGLPGTTACSYTNTSRSIPTVVPGYGGAWARGIVLATTSNGYISNFYIRGLESYSGSVTAFDIVTDSANIVVEEFTIRDGWAASWVDSTAYGMYTDVPTPWPTSIGLHVDSRATNVELVSYCANGIYSPFGEDFKIAVGNSVVDGGEYENCHKGGEPWWVWLVLAIVCLIFILALVAIIMACMSGSGGDNTYQEMKNI